MVTVQALSDGRKSKNRPFETLQIRITGQLPSWIFSYPGDNVHPASCWIVFCRLFVHTHFKLNRYSWIAWKRLQSTGRSIDWVMVDLEAWRRKMSWAPVWPLCCSARHTLMWFWSNKYLKGRRPISTARIRKKLHPGSKDIFSKDWRCDFWINTH